MKCLASLIIIFLASVSPAHGTQQPAPSAEQLARAEQLFKAAVAKADQNVEAAIRDLTEAIKLNPEMDKAYWKRGELYDRQNLREKATEDIKKARSLRAFKAAMELIQSNDFPGAIKSFGQVIDEDPDFYEAYYQRGLLYGADGKYVQAVNDLSNAVRLNRDHVDAWYFRGLFNLESGNLPAAIADLRRTIDLNEDYVDAYVSLGDAYLKQEKFPEAEQVYSEALSLKGDDADVLNGLGYALIKLGKTREALTHLKKADGRKPNDPQIMSNLGLAHFEAGNLDPARNFLERAKVRDKDNSEIWHRLGDVYSKLRQTSKAQEHWREASTLLPDTDVEQKNVLREKINRLSATPSSDTVASSTPNPHQPAVKQQTPKVDSDTAGRRGNDEERPGPSAQESNNRPADDARRQRQDDARILPGGGQPTTGNTREGAVRQPSRPPTGDGPAPLSNPTTNTPTDLNRAALDNRLNNDNDSAVSKFLIQGKGHQHAKDWKGAEKSFRTALSMQPNNPNVLNELGHTLIQLGRLDPAYDQLMKAIALSPRDPKISSNLGLLYYKKGELETAEIYLRDALKMEPDSTLRPLVFERLGDVFDKQGRNAESNSEKKRAVAYFKDAQLYWNRAAQITSDEEQKKELQRKLKSLAGKI